MFVLYSIYYQLSHQIIVIVDVLQVSMQSKKNLIKLFKFQNFNMGTIFFAFLLNISIRVYLSFELKGIRSR